jgi:diadenosine tetraphosphate (Ap4A) HIT family hydrolase
MIYEDQIVTAELVQDAATHGHVVIRTRHGARLSDLPPEESAHLFLVINYTAAILFQGLKAAGTNIIVQESEQPNGTLEAHVIARTQEDGLSFTWQPQSLTEEAMKDAEERIKEKTFFLGRPATEKRGKAPESAPTGPPPDEKGTEEAPESDGENYLIKQLIRLP